MIIMVLLSTVPDDLEKILPLIEHDVQAGHNIPGDLLVEILRRGVRKLERPDAGQAPQVPGQLQLVLLS